MTDFATIAAAHPRCIWLDGGGARDWSRQTSLLGWCDPGDVSLSYSAARREVTRHADARAEVVGEDIWEALAAEMGPSDQWFGYFGYACRSDLPALLGPGGPGDDPPDAVWMRPTHLRLFEHQPSGTSTDAGAPTVAARPQQVPSDYADGFGIVRDALYAGDSYEANLTYRLTRESTLGPAEIYLRLRALNPAPYAGFLQHDVDGAGAWLLSSSPERYAVIDSDRWIEARPIKGTTPRGETAEQDEAHRLRLASEQKFRAENLMIADLLRNDLSMVCQPGTVSTPDLMAVESYASVHQLVTTVRGRLREDISSLEALRRIFPAGSMTGAPKRRTMEVIERAETSPRGPYAGAFGWIGGDGSADLGVVIRSLTSPDGQTWTVGTGGGITVASTVAEEYAEAELKASLVLDALDAVQPPARAEAQPRR